MSADTLLLQYKLLGAHGSAGLDGWTAHEAKTLARHFPVLAQESYDLWVETVGLKGQLDPNLVAFLYSVRIAGIPKGDDSRPLPSVKAWRLWMSLELLPWCDQQV